MTSTVNGTGISICKAGNLLTWDGNKSFDAVECVVVFFLPIIPLKFIHTFDWNERQFRMAPLRWSANLVALAFLRRWLCGVMILGTIFGLLGLKQVGSSPWLTILGLSVAGAAGIVLLALSGGDSGRDQKIRRVLGPHGWGTSDPATWTAETLATIYHPADFFHRERFRQDFQAMLDEGRYSEAMWTARYCKVLGDDAEGERLTDVVLNHPEVQTGLAQIGDNSRLWQALFAPTHRSSQTWPTLQTGAGSMSMLVGLMPPAATEGHPLEEPLLSDQNQDNIQDKSRRDDTIKR